MKIFKDIKLTESLGKQDIQQVINKFTKGTVTAYRDKIHTNFFTVDFKPDATTGMAVALGQKTMIGQQAEEAEKQALPLAKILQQKFAKEIKNMEDSDIESRNGRVVLFMVSDEFKDPKWNLQLKNK